MAGVYIHIPICHSKCAYCDFYSQPSAVLADDICSAIAAEYKLRCDESDDRLVRTLYVGGGTPSVLSPRQLACAIEPVPRDNIEEFTIEVNPEDVTVDKARCWIELGVNRISMGVQSFNDEELSYVGRRHSASGALEAFDSLRKAGFDNISLDFIYGLPLQDLESWNDTLRQLMQCRPEHFSAYALSYEPGTRLSARVASGKLSPTDDETVAYMYEMLCEYAMRYGYRHYEISNFAKPGFHSHHNSSYWNSTPYLGLGPAAHSFDGLQRRYNPSDTRRWLAAVKSGRSAAVIDPESESERIGDIIFTRLRTDEGLPLSLIPESYRNSLLETASAMPQGHVELIDNVLRIPQRHWLISDAIIRELLP